MAMALFWNHRALTGAGAACSMRRPFYTSLSQGGAIGNSNSFGVRIVHEFIGQGPMNSPTRRKKSRAAAVDLIVDSDLAGDGADCPVLGEVEAADLELLLRPETGRGGGGD